LCYGLKKIPQKTWCSFSHGIVNSKINHPDYQCNSTPGVVLAKRLNSDHFKLYDIYHMQIDEGDIIETIRDNHNYIGHYHTAGVPGMKSTILRIKLQCYNESYS
jgi:sugar phosphate isomerase/epimerase